jgi:HupE / UreJ protein
VRPPAAVAALALLGALASARPAGAHTLGNGYLALTIDDATVSGQLDIAFRDLHDAIGLDGDHDGALRWREVLARQPEIERYLRAHLRLWRGDAPCPLGFGALAAVSRADGAHLAVPVTARCDGAIAALGLDYAAIFEVDAQHRGLVRVARAAGDDVVRLIERPGRIELRLAAGADGDGSASRDDLLGFVRQGVWHIWIGVDHLCFLIALLLPSVLRRRDDAARWQPADHFGEVLRDVLTVVTAFTLAHSITLILSSLGWLRLPVRLVETAIALSVAVAALNNLVRGVDARWAVGLAP